MRVEELIELLKKCPQNDIVMVDIENEEANLDIYDVLVGAGTLKGFSYISLKKDMDE